MSRLRISVKSNDAAIKDALRGIAKVAKSDDDYSAKFIIDQLATVRSNAGDIELLFRAIMRDILDLDSIDWYVKTYIRS